MRHNHTPRSARRALRAATRPFAPVDRNTEALAAAGDDDSVEPLHAADLAAEPPSATRRWIEVDAMGRAVHHGEAWP